ncbi:unnamed protein product [Pleuronectes platessa]|uniref:Uncharacterized protein n=1 Tax=Pleuronectes platessa TaxID=8262 RepID=A0A9N7TP23_PLEPL|nr:unnamed protein product [Pleuronectes platessa]
MEIRSFLGATGNEHVEELGSGEEARGGGPRVAAELTSVVALQHVEPVLKLGYANLFLQSARAGQLIASLVIGGLGRGHGYHLAHGTANMAGFLFHLPRKLNHFCAKIDCCEFA